MLDVLQKAGEHGGQLGEGDGLLFVGIAAEHDALAVFHVARADLHAHGHALELPVVELEAGREGVAVIELDADAGGPELVVDLGALLHHAALVRGHGHDDGLNGRDVRGELEAALVAVGHDDGPDEAGGHAPAGLMDVGELAFLAEVLDIVGLGEVGAEVVAGAGLQGLAVLHHGLHGVGGPGAGELFLVALLSHVYGQGQGLFGHLTVDLQHGQGLLLGLLGGGVDGVALLPEELAGAKEGARALFPAHHAAPLVVLHGQVAPAAHPLGIHGAEDRLARGAHGQALLQLLAAALGHPRHLRREALHVLGLLEQQAFGDEHGHVDVLVAAFLEAAVELLLDALPDGEAVGADDHAAANRRVVNQLAL